MGKIMKRFSLLAIVTFFLNCNSKNQPDVIVLKDETKVRIYQNFDKRLKLVQNKLITDSISFKRFVFLGKCNCLDIIDSANTRNSFDRTFFWMKSIGFSIPNFFLKEKLLSIYNYQLIDQLDKVLIELQKRDEHFLLKHSPEILCELLWENKDISNKKYRQLVTNKENYLLINTSINVIKLNGSRDTIYHFDPYTKYLNEMSP